jgi:curved DNA-binding protein CbpA/transcription elongation GreA/GreB family factor
MVHQHDGAGRRLFEPRRASRGVGTAVKSHYDNLKVARDAPIDDIRTAYRSLIKKYHPNRNPGNAEAARITKILHDAYETLTDPVRRKNHDEWIAREERASPKDENQMDSSSADVFDGSLSVPEVLRRLQHRLLDLTARNRLLNFKITVGKAMPLVPGRLDETFRRLTGPTPGTIQMAPVPDPSRDEWVIKNDRTVKPEAKDYAVHLGLNVQLEETEEDWDDAKIARAQYYNEDLAKHFRKIDREARLALEETGANMLFLVLGCLDYTENPGSDKVLSAPLVCVPVKLNQVHLTNQTFFNFSYTGEEIHENLSLRERLKRDHSFTSPDFPEEDDGVEKYFRQFEKLIEKRPHWKVRRSMTLALLSFANMLLIRDLEPDNWSDAEGNSTLLDHPVIKRIFKGGNGETAQGYAEEYDLDRLPSADLPFIYDADSSQHSAIMDVMAGKSLVIEGPPGTGKSQTITNIIASCLHAGKSVLFVAEKLTALQVVQRRLQAAGLDPFLLELHSNKTNKRQVLESLQSRLDVRTSAPPGLDGIVQKLAHKKQTLNEYATLLNTATGNRLGLTVHQILWRAEQSRIRLGDYAEALLGIAVDTAPHSNATTLEKNLDHIKSLAQTLKDIGKYDATSPFWGFYPDTLAPGDDLAVEKIFQEALKFADAAKEASLGLAATYGLHENDAAGLATPSTLIGKIENLKSLLPDDAAVDVLPAFFGTDPAQQENAFLVLEKNKATLQSIVELETTIASRVDYKKAEHARLNEAVLRFVQQSGIGQLSVAELERSIQQLGTLWNAATSAQQGLNKLLEDAGLTEDSFEGYTKLKTITEVSAAAPLSRLHLRSSELAKPNATEILNKGNTDRIRLQLAEDRLSERIYMDQAPSDADLRQYILVLREGHTWYRVFQKPWRTAIAAHRSLSRDKSKKPTAQRLAEFEELSDHRKTWSAWTNSAPLTRTVGVAPLPLDYPLLDAANVAKWLKESGERFEQANVGQATFDPITIKRSRIVSFSAKQSETNAHCGALQELNAWVMNSCPQLQGWNDAPDWSHRLAAAKTLLERLQEVSSDFSGAIHADQTLEHGYVLVQQAHELLAKSNEVAGSEALKRVLGSRASRFREDLPAIMAAVRFGQTALDTALPSQTKQMLLTPRAKSTLDDLKQGVSKFSEYRDQLRKTLLRLESYGVLEIDSWLPDSTEEDTGTEVTREFLQTTLEQINELIPWSLYVHYRAECENSGLDAFISVLEDEQVPPDSMVDAYSYRFYASIAESLFRQTPAMHHFSGQVHSNVRQEFSKLDRDLIAVRGKQVSHQNCRLARPVAGQNGTRVADKTEMSLIHHLLPQARPRISLRDLLYRAAQSIQQLKPCYMMGPQAVAQYLRTSPEMFDLVIMDEASQMRPEQAIGAIARAKQLVVVGDPKQLPPTSFFTRMQTEGDVQDVAAAEEAESILDLARGHFPPTRSLRWHYRSRHESLIAFSNHQFYDGKLIVFPSPYPRSRGLGVRMHYVKNAIYESQTNLREATAVVDAVVDHILHTPELSLGVVALNIRQRDLIAELLEERLKATPGAEDYRSMWNDDGQDIFVKNLENVQGDERDTIIISTTYGPPPGANRVHQHFGPISQEGGWRRLNVLFTRAKSAVLLITSMKHTDIVVGAGTPRGTKALRDYLLYAETGRLNYEPGEATGRQPDSEFEEAVITALQDRGYECVPQVGVANFRIDIGVKHPQYPHLFLAAIECDGATYHSGITARDRDRIRQEILESMGWKGKIWRIWSTEWFRNPNREMARLTSFLEELKRQEVDPSLTVIVDAQSANSEDDSSEPSLEQVQQANETLEQLVTEKSKPEVQIGDHVIYRNLSDRAPEREITVLIAKDRFDPNNGIISEASPLGQALIGAVEGDEVPFSTPAKPDQTLFIVTIKRING